MNPLQTRERPMQSSVGDGCSHGRGDQLVEPFTARLVRFSQPSGESDLHIIQRACGGIHAPTDRFRGGGGSHLPLLIRVAGEVRHSDFTTRRGVVQGARRCLHRRLLLSVKKGGLLQETPFQLPLGVQHPKGSTLLGTQHPSAAAQGRAQA
eukprot:4969922-Amphidinium_carterae.2